jgi:hypothetical protein
MGGSSAAATTLEKEHGWLQVLLDRAWRWFMDVSTTKSYHIGLVFLGRAEILEHVQKEYNIHSAYGVVLCAVTEQVAHFALTQYPPDARGAIEDEFENFLTFDKRGGFTLPLRQTNDTESFNEEVLQTWFSQMQALGGPRLLERGPSTRTDNDNENDGKKVMDAPAAVAAGGASAGFQSDRRPRF